MKTVIMKLVKENKTLVEYAEVDKDFQKILKPAITPIYIRKGVFDVLPNSILVTISAES